MKLVILITEETLLGKFIFTFLLGILFISFGYFFIKKDNKNFIKNYLNSINNKKNTFWIG